MYKKHTFLVHASSEEVEASIHIDASDFCIKKKKKIFPTFALHLLFVKSEQHLNVTSIAV